MVWHHAPLEDQYWNWASEAQPWIELQEGVVALFRYPAQCLAHKCPGHPNKGPLYMALHAPTAVPLGLDRALRTHLKEHLGGNLMLH